jgi:hypothetical protein
VLTKEEVTKLDKFPIVVLFVKRLLTVLIHDEKVPYATPLKSLYPRLVKVDIPTNTIFCVTLVERTMSPTPANERIVEGLMEFRTDVFEF